MPTLLHALQSMLKWAVASDWETLPDVIHLTRLLLIESEHARKSATVSHTPSAISNDGQPTCAEILPTLLDLVQKLALSSPHLALSSPRIAILTGVLDGLNALFWCEPLVCISTFC